MNNQVDSYDVVHLAQVLPRQWHAVHEFGILDESDFYSPVQQSAKNPPADQET